MKQITVLIDRGNGWEILHEGLERVRVVLDPADKEVSQVGGYLFDPNAPDSDETELPEWS